MLVIKIEIITTICVYFEAETMLRKNKFIGTYCNGRKHYPDKSLPVSQKGEVRREILVSFEDWAKVI